MWPGLVTLANLVAMAVFVALAACAVWLTLQLGFVALLLLGLVTWLVCLRAGLNEDVPTWSTEVFRARMTDRHRAHPSEAHAALTFYRRCGILLTAVGAAGCAWMLMH